MAGVLLPAFCPRRTGDLGIGDTVGMRQWVDWAAEYGAGFLQLLPIHETGADHSPYNGISSVALDPVYVAFDGGEVPGLTAEELAEAVGTLGCAAGARLVDYERVKRVKHALLERAWERFATADRRLQEEFAAFREEERDWLEPYEVYRWLMERHGDSEAWDQWPEDCRDPAGARALLERERCGAVEARLGFFAFVQWLCFRQWRGLKRYAGERGVKLMGDVPIGVSWYSADVFFEREQFDLEWSGGAPPETVFKHDRFIQQWGQNWGIPLYRWDRMEKDGYAWWKRRVRKLAECFHLFRIDHVLGLYRIYAFPWRPQRNAEFLDRSAGEAKVLTGGRLPRWAWRSDETVQDRAANRADGDRRLRAILEAAGETAVAGEDLGCVPDYVRPHLASLGVAGFRIPHWSVNGQDRVVPGRWFPECSFATYATHDHEPLAAMWTGDRRAARAVHTPEGREAERNLRLLAEFAGLPQAEGGAWPAYHAELRLRLTKALFASCSRYAALMVTDVFGLEDRINRPGTVGGENWRFRVPFAVEEIRRDPSLRAASQELAALIRSTGRG